MKTHYKKAFLSLFTLLITLDTFGLAPSNSEIIKKTTERLYTLDTYQIIISLAPLALFFIITAIIFFKLKKENYKIGDALKENDTITVTTTPSTSTQESAPPSTTPVAQTETIQPKSASRLIAFISGMVSMGLASSFCSFWTYNYFQTGISADLSAITNVLLSLGLGVVPYAFNKVSKAIQ
jgi:uncharacterized membrane protein YciS (DUF1049 family)